MGYSRQAETASPTSSKEDVISVIPNNHVTDTAIRLSLENRLFGMHYFSTQETPPTYVFVVERTRKAINCYARAATREHDAILLKSSVASIVIRSGCVLSVV
ncbi:hypothetical protein PENTCL1PPCAC_9803 [Pristionchus entomophagus]|uniref:Uncharacterized protein n=1 Tax=Pristionchus entomophagus TaxID=358040 RepID=A0AAV5T461_9BILA|nr:hypothetical protein PENTCL1PPCAC_9803 [Pristionchus entomophagus]